MAISLQPSRATMRRLAEVAQGHAPAGVVLSGGGLVNVFTEEIQEGWGLAIAEDRIAFTGPDGDVLARAGPETERIDLGGDLVAPGLIEGHTHLTRIGMADFADSQLRCGVTTSVVETMEVAAICGAAGVLALLDAAGGMAGRLFFTISGLIVGDPVQDAGFRTEDWIPLLDHPRVAGLGETYWADLLRGHPRTEALISAALERGLAVEGHAAGARPQMLNALAGFGIGADHEGISAEDELARLRLGLWVHARHGATRRDLAAIAPLWASDRFDPGRLTLVTDGLEPDALLRGESLNWVVEQAVGHDMPFQRAVRLASRNVAERFGWGRWLGGLGPGMLADVCVVSPGGFRPRLVLVGGRPADGSTRAPYPEWMRETVRVPGLDDELLRPPGPGRWRAMEFVAPLVTREVESDGRDALVCTVVERTGGSRSFRGLLRGFGLREGGVAISSAWESPAVLLVGDTPADLAIAARRVEEMRGGAAVVARGRVLTEWRAPVAGLYSEAPASEVLVQVQAVNRALGDLGVPWPNPVLSLETLTTAAIPFLRISPAGYFRLRDGAQLPLEA